MGGDKGYKGYKGDKGNKGDKGDKGDKGFIAGDKGLGTRLRPTRASSDSESRRHAMVGLTWVVKHAMVGLTSPTAKASLSRAGTGHGQMTLQRARGPMNGAMNGPAFESAKRGTRCGVPVLARFGVSSTGYPEAGYPVLVH